MVPVLEVEGHTISQSNAIARYLAKKHNLAGKNDWESLECDILVDTLSDLKQALSHYRGECDSFKKEEKKMTLMKETIPFYMEKFEATLNENKGFSVGESVSWYLIIQCTMYRNITELIHNWFTLKILF